MLTIWTYLESPEAGESIKTTDSLSYQIYSTPEGVNRQFVSLFAIQHEQYLENYTPNR